MVVEFDILMQKKIDKNLVCNGGKFQVAKDILIELKREKLTSLKNIRILEARVLELNDQIKYMEDKYGFKS